ncbi:hypothetical protein B0S90_1925 [Caldicellulosiruptor bescii]|uniref:Uncharacterized protein n=5 Tax=Caldicellulosiruptor TaxID=44000 RepID=B9MK65_CALBD|nr:MULTISPECIES: hypothetical protein [Caldicellulosiruptor]ACM60723.1 conserved hypothetical protein [Caldicellulosiruptor bescii DSM 6725]ADQ06844.1 conserved hypothetical protein [Caldicellulosiruptor hydrothermalis 108]ADQ45962.1 hypothetical protein Calkro_1096 [Caldicellulosiruptor kronotskyensis 2002]PBC89462.1 hypothetical protein B0S87_2562 [Caldicellulosiruptor bescii]PBC91053.1 hypothetical protein B0S89_1426 [Caldicellulosiruptor bescii]
MKGSIDILSQISQLKEVDYKNTLMITSLIEVLVDKGIIARKEVFEKSIFLDRLIESEAQRRIEKST